MTRMRLQVCLFVTMMISLFFGLRLWFPAENRLNVILITIDTARADHFGCYGYSQALTPTIDDLAKRGVVFDRAYTSVPLTLPAHASIHTGLLPFEHGLFTNSNHGLPERIPTLAESLWDQGYSTGAFIASLVMDRRFGLDRGFEVYDDNLDGPPTIETAGTGIRSADQIIDRVISWLTLQNHKPFFCWVHLFDPHAQYLEHRESFGDKFQNQPYDAEIAFVDLQLKRLFNFLDDRRLADRTMIVLVGDHGEGLNEHRERWHGYMLYNSTLRVPLIVTIPMKSASAHRVADPVSLIDIAPTVLDCLDLPPLQSTSGRSLKPALLNESLPSRICYAVAKEVQLEEGWSPLSCLITPEWKLIQTTKPELYDLRNDPDELSNLADSQSEKLHELRQILLEIEASGTRYDRQAVVQTEKDRRSLTGLGYLGGTKATDTNQDRETRPDLKDHLEDFDAFQGTLELCISGKSELAVAPLYQLISVAPRYLAPRLLLAQILNSQKKTEEAENQYLAILDIDPENLETLTNLGILLASHGQYEAALKQMLVALKGSPLSSSLHMSIGNVLRELKRPREATSHFQMAENLARQQRTSWKPRKPR